MQTFLRFHLLRHFYIQLERSAYNYIHKIISDPWVLVPRTSLSRLDKCCLHYSHSHQTWPETCICTVIEERDGLHPGMPYYAYCKHQLQKLLALLQQLQCQSVQPEQYEVLRRPQQLYVQQHFQYPRQVLWKWIGEKSAKYRSSTLLESQFRSYNKAKNICDKPSAIIAPRPVEAGAGAGAGAWVAAITIQRKHH